MLRGSWTQVGSSVVATEPSIVSRSELAPSEAGRSLGSVVSHQPAQGRAHRGAGTPARPTATAAGTHRSTPAMLGTSRGARCRPSSAHGRARHTGNCQQNAFQCYCGNILSSSSSCGSASLVPKATLHVCDLTGCNHQAHSERGTSLTGRLLF